MASGKTHDWVTNGFLLPVFLTGRYLCHLDWGGALLLTLGTWAGGILLSPDLDTHSRPFYRWGIFRFIWTPYQWLARHRSPVSHGLWWSPWLRFLYLSAVLILVYMGASIFLSHLIGSPSGVETSRQQVNAFLNQHYPAMLLLGGGIWLGSALHVLLDGISSACSKRRSHRP